MEKVRKVFSSSTTGLLIFSGLLIFASVFIQVLNTIFRKWFGFAILWCDEVTQYAAVEACFLATPYLVMHGKELSVGILDAIITKKSILKVIRLIFVALELFIFYLLMRYCITAAEGLRSSGVMLNTVHVRKYVLYYIAEITFVLDFICLLSAPILNKGGFYSD